MRNQYSSVTISGYNASPPPDDGSQTSANRVEWAKHKTKLADPIKTLSENINTGVNTAFGKIPFYADNPQTGNYTATSADDGKWIPFTATGNLTLASATSYGEGWTTMVVNQNAAGFVGIVPAATDYINNATDTAVLAPGMAALLVGNGASGVSALFGGHRITVSTLTGSATTWSKTGVKQALVFCQAGGAGGGSADTTNNSDGGGGGGGACAIKFLTAAGFATFATTEACRVATGGAGGSTSAGGNGGDSIFGAGSGVLSATGGLGGGRDSGGTGADGGAGGSAPSTGDVNIKGGGGANAQANSNQNAPGGSAFLGGGARGETVTADSAGEAGGQYGGGGSGSHRETGNAAGGAGAAGVIYVIEWR